MKLSQHVTVVIVKNNVAGIRYDNSLTGWKHTAKGCFLHEIGVAHDCHSKFWSKIQITLESFKFQTFKQKWNERELSLI